MLFLDFEKAFDSVEWNFCSKHLLSLTLGQTSLHGCIYFIIILFLESKLMDGPQNHVKSGGELGKVVQFRHFCTFLLLKSLLSKLDITKILRELNLKNSE